MNIAPNLEQRWRAIPSLGWLLVITLLCLVPFLAKPFHIDDTLFLRVAQHIQKHPTDFYGFTINWYGTTQSVIRNFDNPPLACYYIALVAAIGGWGEWVLHLAFLLPALASVWGIFALAKQYCSRPFLAATAAVLTPVFLISSTTIMCDVLLLAFSVWAVVFFEKGLQQNNWRGFLISGLLAGLAFWTKFTGLALVPLLAAYGLCQRFRIGAKRRTPALREELAGAAQSWSSALRQGWLWLLTPLVVLIFVAGYEWITFRLYGKGLFLASARDSSAIRTPGQGGILGQELLGLGFLGGCFLPVLFYTPFLWPRRAIWKGLLLLLPIAFLCSFCAPFKTYVWQGEGHPNWVLLVETVVFITGGIHVLILVANEVWERREAVSVLLLLWILGILVFATVCNWTCNGRSVLPMLPAIGILLARRLERCSELVPANRFCPLLWPGLAAAAVTLLLTQADYELAQAGRAAARDLCAKYGQSGRKLWFQAHWGFQYYMEQGGAKALELDLSEIRPGDLMVIPSEACNIIDVPCNIVRIVDVLKYTPNRYCSIECSSAGAGFYAATAGPFPFSAARSNPECYYVFEVVQTLAAATQSPAGISLTGALAEQFDLEHKALAWLKAVRANPDNADAHLQLAKFFASRSRLDAAVKHLSEVVRLRPADESSRTELALLLNQVTPATASLKR